MNPLKQYAAFLAAVLTAKKIISVPSGYALRIDLSLILLAVTLVDFVQIPFFEYIYDKGFEKIRFLKWLEKKLYSKEKFTQTLLGRIAERLKVWGVFAIFAWPLFGGGIWTAVLFGRMFGIRRVGIYVFTLLGSISSSIVLYYSAKGVINFLSRYS